MLQQLHIHRPHPGDPLPSIRRVTVIGDRRLSTPPTIPPPLSPTYPTRLWRLWIELNRPLPIAIVVAVIIGIAIIVATAVATPRYRAIPSVIPYVLDASTGLISDGQSH